MAVTPLRTSENHLVQGNIRDLSKCKLPSSSHLHTSSSTMAEANPVVFFDIALGGKWALLACFGPGI